MNETTCECKRWANLVVRVMVDDSNIPELAISIDRLRDNIENLAKIGATDSGGISRFALSKEEFQARRLIIDCMKRVGLEIRIDNVGNLYGRRKGSERELAPIMTGSHIDTQPNGGRFDGALGVLGAIESLTTLNENNITTRHPIEVVVFVNEEGHFIPGMSGSKAIAGISTVEETHQSRNAQGITYLDAMKRGGLDPSSCSPAKKVKGEIHAFVELHIEQAPRLYKEKIPIGIVQNIVGLTIMAGTIIGRADHQALSLDLRKDALLAAAEIVLAVNQIPRGISETAVGLVGKLNVFPGASSVVPGRVEFTVDLRDIEGGNLKELENRVTQKVAEVCGRRGLQYRIETSLRVEPAHLSEVVIHSMERAVGKLKLNSKKMYSGAGHDTQNMAKITDVGMIFVPSKDGRSHCPEEWTDWDAVERGCNVLLHTLLELDQA